MLKFEVEVWSWRNLKLKKFEVEEFWSWRKLKSKKFEVEEIWGQRNLKSKKLEVKKIWSQRNLNLKKFEGEKNWSWSFVTYLNRLTTFILLYLASLKLSGGGGWLDIAILMITKSSGFDFDFDCQLWLCKNQVLMIYEI